MVCWIVNQYIGTPDMAGGSRHYELAKVLTDKGHEVVLISARRRNEERLYYYEWKEGFIIIWINIERYYGRSLRRIINMILFSILVLGFYLTSVSKLKLCKSPDVIIGSSVHLFGAYAALVLSRVYCARFVFEIRDLWPETLIEMGALTENNPITKVMRHLEEQLCKKSAFIISVLPFAHEYLSSRYHIDVSKVKWLPNGVDPGIFPEEPTPEGESFQITYIGAFGIANALDAVLEAAKIIQNEDRESVLFNFYGDGPLKGELIKKANKLGLKQVSFKGPIPKAELHRLARHTNAFIVNLKALPLYIYGISLNKLYDYMAMRRPTIIGSCARNNPIKDAEAGISVLADNPLAIADGIRKLLRTPREEIILMGENGRRYIQKYHHYVLLGEKLETWLREALKSV